MSQLEHLEAIERRLWSAADTLRANSEYASNEYFLPVMGLVFLRHAYSRYLTAKQEIEPTLPSRGGQPRALTKEDFSQRSAIFLKPEAQFDYLVALPDSVDRAKALMDAMESIESNYASLHGVLPKNEYQKLDNHTLGDILRLLNPDELKQVSGDVFGRIYEYFLTQFADQKAHDNGEFFTPVSLVALIAQVLDPRRGSVLDPACGSGGMFVQSARTVEEHGQNPTEQLTFRGLEKNATTIRLAKMNLAVHGLEGDVQQAITYYQDPHELVGKADYVMANPPFNVDEIDAGKIEKDPRLPFGLPGVNKKGKVSNGNYVWISYFYSYLNRTGRAGFVMSSQASSAGGAEAKVRQKLVETGDVDIMIAIRSNFFYTRTVPCELWFLNRAKPEQHRDTVLMIDARTVYRKVTRKIYDFSPEQQQNILAIVWLYRGQTDKFLALVCDYCRRTLNHAAACFSSQTENTPTPQALPAFVAAVNTLNEVLQPFLNTLPAVAVPAGLQQEMDTALATFHADVQAFQRASAALREELEREWALEEPPVSTPLPVERLAPLAASSRELARQTDLIYKLASRLSEACENAGDAKSRRDLSRARKAADEARQRAVEQLQQVGYFWRQADWLTEHFPNAELCDVDGLVKLVDRAEIKANDWSLTPGRYVGVAPEEDDEDFDFRQALGEIHAELDTLNTEAVSLAAIIKKNFEDLGI